MLSWLTTHMTMSKIQTYSGKVVDFLNPEESMIDITDIAHALSMICRFSGNTTRFYSVAEHSINCSYIVPEHLALQALLHDATEAYVGDLNKPLKGICPNYQDIEHHLWLVIANKFGVPEELDDMVKGADLMMLHEEKIQLLKPCKDPHLWENLKNIHRGSLKELGHRSLSESIFEYQERIFLERFHALTRRFHALTRKE